MQDCAASGDRHPNIIENFPENAFYYVRNSLLRDDAYVPRGADPESGVWVCSRNGDPNTRKREFVTDCIIPVFSLADGSGSLENVDTGLYAFKNSVVSIFGFKSENSQTSFPQEKIPA